MISISTNDLTYGTGVREIVGNISFSLEEGDRLAVVGVNGSGKSTLLRMLYGEYVPERGSVYIAKDKSIGMLHQDDAFNIIGGAEVTVLGQMYAAFPELCRLEERLAELQYTLDTIPPSDTDELCRVSAQLAQANSRFVADGGLYYKSKCKSILSNLGFGEEYYALPVTSLSGGQRTRLALARLLSYEPDILILDEPTNHLDLDTMVWLEDHLAAYSKNKTVILVSHDRLFLDKVTNKTLDIENGRAKLYKCSYSQYVIEKENYRRDAEKHYYIQQKEIARLEAYIEQQRRWNRERNIIAAESREKAIARMEKVEKPKNAPRSIKFSLSSSGESGNDVCNVKNLTMGFGDNILFRNVSFLVKKRDRLFISGPNGCGKSTMIKVLLGQLEPLAGEIEFGYNVTVGYYDQENQNLCDTNTVLDELWNAYPNLNEVDIRNTLAMFMFRGDDIEKTVSVLSGGERARLTFAKLILSKMNLLILDEPTNHLDIESREALENALSAFGGTVIAVSHDRYFTRRLSTRFIDLGAGGYDFIGSYDEFSAFREARHADTDSSEKTVQSAGKDEYLMKKKAAAEKRRAEHRYADIKKEICRLEARIEEIDSLLFGEAATDYVRAASLTDEKNAAEERLLALYEKEAEFPLPDCDARDAGDTRFLE